MSIMHYIGAIVVMALITVVGVFSGKKVKTISDFTTSSKSAGTGIITGSLIGTLVGGASTIGTAQLAFTYGLSAWWFTLGGGIGLLIMYLFYAEPICRRSISTLPQLFALEYGKKVAVVATILMSLGTFLSIVSQTLSGIALVTSISSLTPMAAAIVVVLLMLVYVVFGGVWGTGIAGIVKTLLLYATTLICGYAAVHHANGITLFASTLPKDQYFNLFSRGFLTDGGAGLSLVFGVLTTQAYIQAVASAKSVQAAKNGALLAGILTPAIGVAGILVGMYMRIAEPRISSGGALPLFVLHYLPPFWGGMVLATLLIALVGTGAGLSLGLSSMFCHDIYCVYLNRTAADRTILRVSRATIIVILSIAAVVALGDSSALILDWSFMSMGLRGAVAFAPLSFALFMPGKVAKKYAFAAVLIGPFCVLVGKFLLPKEIDPLFSGVAVALLIMIAGVWYDRRNLKQKNTDINNKVNI